MNATCRHSDCPHEARKRSLALEKAARALPIDLLALGTVHAGQLCGGCDKKLEPGEKVWADNCGPWAICGECVEKVGHNRGKKVTLAEFGKEVEGFVPTRHRKVDMRRFWIESVAV